MDMDMRREMMVEEEEEKMMVAGGGDVILCRDHVDYSIFIRRLRRRKGLQQWSGNPISVPRPIIIMT